MASLTLPAGYRMQMSGPPFTARAAAAVVPELRAGAGVVQQPVSLLRFVHIVSCSLTQFVQKTSALLMLSRQQRAAVHSIRIDMASFRALRHTFCLAITDNVLTSGLEE